MKGRKKYRLLTETPLVMRRDPQFNKGKFATYLITIIFLSLILLIYVSLF